MPSLRFAYASILRKLREEAGITQERLAQKARVSRNFIGNVERGESSLSLEAADRIANALNVSLSDFIVAVERLRR